MSAAIAGADRNAAVVARMKLNMNAHRISTWLTPSWSRSSPVPVSRASAHEVLEAEPGQHDDDRGQRSTRAHRVRRRSASSRVSRTMLGDERGGWSPGSTVRSAGLAEQPEEALLERRPSRLHGVDLSAGGDDRRPRAPGSASARSGGSSAIHRRRSAGRTGRGRPAPPGRARSRRTRTASSPSSSSSVPAATTRPASTIATRSHTSSTSDRRCEFRKTVVPRSRAARMIRRTSARPTGSSADVGSSRRRAPACRAGRRPGRAAAACPSRTCRPGRRPARRDRPSRARSRSRSVRSGRPIPARSQWRARTSRARSQGW